MLSYSKNLINFICSGPVFKIIKQFSIIHLSSRILPVEF